MLRISFQHDFSLKPKDAFPNGRTKVNFDSLAVWISVCTSALLCRTKKQGLNENTKVYTLRRKQKLLTRGPCRREATSMDLSCLFMCIHFHLLICCCCQLFIKTPILGTLLHHIWTPRIGRETVALTKHSFMIVATASTHQFMGASNANGALYVMQGFS